MIHDTLQNLSLFPWSPTDSIIQKTNRIRIKSVLLGASRRKRIKNKESSVKKRRKKNPPAANFQLERSIDEPSLPVTRRYRIHIGRAVINLARVCRALWRRPPHSWEGRGRKDRRRKMRVTFLSPRPPRDSIFHPLAAGNRSLRSKLSLKFTLFHLRVSLLSVNVYIGIVATIESLDGKC